MSAKIWPFYSYFWCLNYNIPGELGQCHGCLHRQVISKHGSDYAWLTGSCPLWGKICTILVFEKCKWNLQSPSIGLVNGLAPNWQQTIIWTNADPIHWFLYSTLERDELRSLPWYHNHWNHQEICSLFNSLFSLQQRIAKALNCYHVFASQNTNNVVIVSMWCHHIKLQHRP